MSPSNLFLFCLFSSSIPSSAYAHKTKQNRKHLKAIVTRVVTRNYELPQCTYILWGRALCSLQQGVNLDSSISACCLHFLEMGVLELLLLALSSAQGSQTEERKEKRNTKKGPSEGVGGEGETRRVYTTKLDKSQQ